MTITSSLQNHSAAHQAIDPNLPSLKEALISCASHFNFHQKLVLNQMSEKELINKLRKMKIVTNSDKPTNDELASLIKTLFLIRAKF